jgi:hypothetical protein
LIAEKKITSNRLIKVSEAVTNSLVTQANFAGSTIITVPLLYPSGSHACVQIALHGDRFFVSDLGYGYQESQLIGAEGIFTKNATLIGQKYGVKFDNQSFFVAESSESMLASVVTIVSNCSVECASVAALKASEIRPKVEIEQLQAKLDRIFGANSVEKNSDFIGSSSHKWPVAAKVTNGQQKILFDFVTPFHVSVVSTSAKFHDIARLDFAPRRISIVKNVEKMKDYIGILSQSSNVFELDSEPEVFIKQAA